MKKVVLAIALASSLALSGCATGFNAGTNTQGNSGNGRTANMDNIQVRNAVIVVDEKDQTRATLIATVINKSETADSLKTLEVDPAIKVELSPIELKKNQAVSIGYNSDVKVLMSAAGTTLKAGQFVDVKLVFANNAPIEMSLLVVANNEYYSEVEVPEVAPSAVATPSPSAS